MNTDSYVQILGSRENGATIEDTIIDAGNWSDWGLKVTDNNTGSVVVGSQIIGGRERAVDVVRGHGLRLHECVMLASGHRPITRSRFSLRKTCDIGVKAGSTVTLTGCTFNDILIGDYSIYDNPRAMNPTIVRMDGCVNPNGGPIIVRILNGKLIVNNTDVAVIRLPSLCWKAYYALNRTFGDKRKG